MLVGVFCFPLWMSCIPSECPGLASQRQTRAGGNMFPIFMLNEANCLLKLVSRYESVLIFSSRSQQESKQIRFFLACCILKQ